jgi:hypothetical protein
MKIAEIKTHYDFYSGKVSDLVRQLAFVGLAVVWIFKVDMNGSPKIPHEMALPTVFLILALFLDLVHYGYGTIKYERLYDASERQKKADKLAEDYNFRVSYKWVVRPMDWLLYGKAASVLIAYAMLLFFLVRRVSH